jgi:hypothetical protein
VAASILLLFKLESRISLFVIGRCSFVHATIILFFTAFQLSDRKKQHPAFQNEEQQISIPCAMSLLCAKGNNESRAISFIDQHTKTKRKN